MKRESHLLLAVQTLGTMILGVIMWICILAICLGALWLLHSGINWAFPPRR